MIPFPLFLMAGAAFLGGAPSVLAVPPQARGIVWAVTHRTCPAEAVAPEPGLTTEVALRALVADQWGLPSRSVFFEWGPGPDEIPEHPICLRLLGSGSGGHWVVEISDGEQVVRRRARFAHLENRWFAARDLPRDHTLSTVDMHFEQAAVWGAPRGVAGPEPGWTTRRVIRAGQPLVGPSVSPPLLVEIGSAVEVEVRRGAVLLRVTGESRTAGSLGDDVQVRLPSGRLVWGTVQTGPVVEIRPQQEP
jgi:flagella basal body P-ring formation protein FlgA